MKRYAREFALLLLAFLLNVTPQLAAIGTVENGVRLSVRNAPVPVMVNGRHEVFYELHIENQGKLPLELAELVLGPNSEEGGVTLIYQEQDLRANLDIFDKHYRAAGRDFLRDETEEPYAIYPGMIGVIYINFSLHSLRSQPLSWIHRVDFRRLGETVNRHRESISGGTFTLSQNPPVVLHPPLQGGLWWAYESIDNGAVHRRAMVMEQPTISQRFGVDYIKVGETGTTFRGTDPSIQEEWYGYGEPVFAVADGVVTDFVDGIPENIPLSSERAVPMTIDTINGNYIILDIGHGKYAIYGHMIPDSLTVKLGEKVRRGQVIGRLGNSGNSGGPHLHFHIGNENMVFGTEGLPYVYVSFKEFGRVTIEELQTGGFKADADAKPTIRKREIPGNFSLVEFPQAAN